jgi:hypothetical protein
MNNILKSSRLLNIFAILILFSCQQNQNKMTEPVRVIPMKDFFRNPDIAYFSLSPIGDKISFTKPYKNRMNIFVSSLGSEDTNQVTFIEDRDVEAYFWKTNKRIIYIRDTD